MNWQTKKISIDTIRLILLGFAVAFFLKSQYIFTFLTLGLAFLTIRINDISEFVLSIEDGFRAKYHIPEEKIKEDIIENKKFINKRTLINFRRIEERVLQDIQRKINGEIKKQIHFVYGSPPDFEFAYTPDAVIQTENELIFIEIKYVSEPRFAKSIIRNGINQLKMVLDKFGPSAGKKLVTKLVLASDFDISNQKYKIPKDMELEFYKI